MFTQSALPAILPLSRRLLAGCRRGRSRVALPAVALLLLAGCASVPTEYREPPPLAAAARTSLNARVFDQAWELISDKYYDATFHGVDWPAMKTKYRPEALAAADDDALYQVLNRMCKELKESHLVALSPRAEHERRDRHFAACGLLMQVLDGVRVVTELVPGGPAEKAGVQIGWEVVTRDGQPLHDGETFRNHLDQPVTFEFLDAQNGKHVLTIAPALLDFGWHEARALPNGTWYLRFDRFDYGSLRWLSAQLKEHHAAPAVVIDLRRNSGGLTPVMSMALAEVFPDSVEAGRYIRRSGRTTDATSFAWLPARYPGRILILVGHQTGSAAEIFTHVLQFNHRARVIGQPTAGAVMVSWFYSLPGKGALQVPLEDYVGRDNKRLEGRGVTPDLNVTRTLPALRAGRDLELEAAAFELAVH